MKRIQLLLLAGFTLTFAQYPYNKYGSSAPLANHRLQFQKGYQNGYLNNRSPGLYQGLLPFQLQLPQINGQYPYISNTQLPRQFFGSPQFGEQNWNVQKQNYDQLKFGAVNTNYNNDNDGNYVNSQQPFPQPPIIEDMIVPPSPTIDDPVEEPTRGIVHPDWQIIDESTGCTWEEPELTSPDTWFEKPVDVGGKRKARCNGIFTIYAVYENPLHYYTGGFECCPVRDVPDLDIPSTSTTMYKPQISITTRSESKSPEAQQQQQQQQQQQHDFDASIPDVPVILDSVIFEPMFPDLTMYDDIIMSELINPISEPSISNPNVDPVDPIDPIEPIDPVDPIDPIEPIDPIDPIDPIEPIEPIDPIEPIEPIEPIDPIEPIEPVYPMQTIQFPFQIFDQISKPTGCNVKELMLEELGESSKEGSEEEGKNDDGDKIVIGVIVTFSHGSSYDQLYQLVPQKAGEGEKVAVYEATTDCYELLSDSLSGQSPPAEAVLAVVTDILAVESAAVIFNWECSSGWNSGFSEDGHQPMPLTYQQSISNSYINNYDYSNSYTSYSGSYSNSDNIYGNSDSDSGNNSNGDGNNMYSGNGEKYPASSAATSTSSSIPPAISFIKRALDWGYMVTASDFSLKALIADWDESLLGPNPFVQVGTCSSFVDLEFDPEVLKTSPSGQLQKVGELSEGGAAHVEALGGTIVYSVDMDIVDKSDDYEVQVLTVATKNGGFDLEDVPENLILKEGGRQGTAGHVLVTYPSGGMLLTSATHWVELVRLDVSYDSIIKVARETYGEDYAMTIANEYMSNQGDADAQGSVLQSYGASLIQMNGFQKGRR